MKTDHVIGFVLAAAAMVALPAAKVSASQIQSALVSAYLLDEGSGTTTADIGPAANPDGVLTNSPTWITTTPFAYAGNRALHFNGAGAFVDLGDRSSLYFPTTFSVQFWIRPDDATAAYVLGDYDAGGGASSMAFYYGGSNINFFWQNGGYPTIYSTSSLSTSSYTHVLATYDGTTRRLYINGTLEASDSTAQARGDISSSMAIGRGGSWAGTPLKGDMDEVAFWNAALDQEDVTSLYTQGLAALIPEPASAGLLALGGLVLLRRKRNG